MNKNRIELDSENFLIWRDTPWDSKVFNFSTNEITSIQYTNEKYLSEMLNTFCSHNRRQKVKFSYVRIDANDLKLKKILNKLEFYYAETTQVVYNNRLQKLDIGSIFRTNLPIETPSINDFLQIKQIAERAFHFSRFHEDVNIEKKLAKKRYSNWIDDLIRQQKSFFIHKKADRVISFMAFEETKNDVCFILGGSDIGEGYISPFFWSALFKYFQGRGVKKVKEIKISAANIGIINLYINFHFKVKKTLLGYHRFNF